MHSSVTGVSDFLTSAPSAAAVERQRGLFFGL